MKSLNDMWPTFLEWVKDYVDGDTDEDAAKCSYSREDMRYAFQAGYELASKEDDWISVSDMLPDSIELKKYHVRIEVGSIDVKEVETVMLGKMYPSQFRFMEGDWQRVTHWKEFKDS